PADREQNDNDVHHNRVPKSDPFGASSHRQCEPISETENCCEKTAQHTCGDQPISHVRPMGAAMHQINNVARHRCWQQSEWKDNDNRMHRMPEKINFSCHSEVSFKRTSHRKLSLDAEI